MKGSFSLLLCLALILGGCTSGKRSFEQGDYYAAVIKAVKRLRQNPKHKKSKDILRRGYPLAVKTYEGDVQRMLTSNGPLKYAKVVGVYNKLNGMGNEIRRAPGALGVISNPKNYTKQLTGAKEKAAEESYQLGSDLLSRKTREDAKQAVYRFRDVNNFVAVYKDVNDKLEEAHFMATLKVLVDQFPVFGRYQLSGNFFQDRVEEYLHSEFRSNEFVKFYTPLSAEKSNLPYYDQAVQLVLEDFVVGETHTEKTIEKLSKDSVEVGEVKLDNDSIAKSYGTVKATMTIYRKQVRSNGVLSLRITDARTKAVLFSRKFPGEFAWFSQWGNFNGDERALTAKQIQIAQSEEVPPPPPQQLFLEFTKPIYNQLIPHLNQFYRRY